MRHLISSRALLAALALGLGACSQGGSIESPGATFIGDPPGGGGGGGSGGGGGGGSGTACPLGTTIGTAIGTTTVCNVTGEITVATTLPKLTGIAYRLVGRVDVGRDLGAVGNLATGVAATLTIQPGVTLFGDEAGDMLVVNRGSKIDAIGTPSQPIIFTAKEEIDGTVNQQTSSRLWAGVIIAGRAPVRDCSTAVAQGSVDCQNAVEGVTAATGRSALYGGATAADTSGTMRYVSIRYPGAFLPGAGAGDDLNGLTLGGVGSATDISFVQVHNSGDDGIEVFGGAVNMKNLVITGAADDSLDYDSGWVGNVQYLIIKQANIEGGPDRMVEASNRTVAGTGALNTNPIISNFTMVGLRTNTVGGNLQAISLNNSNGNPGSSGRYLNGVVAGSNVCLSAATANLSPAPTFSSTLFDCPTASDAASSAIITAGSNNSVATPNSLTSALLPGANELARVATNPATLSPFFEAVNYIGAFSSSATVTSNWAFGWTVQLLPAPVCPVGTIEDGTLGGVRNCVLSGVIGSGAVPANLRLTAGNVYKISGRVDVGFDRGGALTGGTPASLTIEPGVRLYGAAASDVLIVNRGSKIFVNGTATSPVIFTSQADITGSQANKATASREWAGVVILGAAPIRGCTTAVVIGSADCQNAVEGISASTGRTALFGGATAADSSGSINYMQIRYPGAFLPGAAAGDDLNGLTLAGVGSGTSITNVQVHNSGDDGIEIFGGTVNMKNWIVTGALDDSLDYDDGWTGKAQFGIVLQALTAAGGPDRMIEGSNRSVAGTGPVINTNPIIANFTFVGVPRNDAQANLTGISLNNTGGTPGASSRLINGVVTGSTTCANAEASNTTPAPRFDSLLFSCTGALGALTSGLVTTGTNNSTAITTTLVGRFINGSAETGRVALNPASVDPFFTATTYIGAVRDAADTWWAGWSCGLAAASTC